MKMLTYNNIIGTRTSGSIRMLLMLMILLLSATLAEAQIKIGGSVYGGGNAGDTGGSTSVTVHAGNLNKVYGGARMANVAGSAFVNIDGEHASDNIFINTVYGGNDIAGTIGSATRIPSIAETTTNSQTNEETTTYIPILTAIADNNIDNSWNAFVRTSPTPETTSSEDRKSLVIGTLFGGGNGEYNYSSSTNEETGVTTHIIKDIDNTTTLATNTIGFVQPALDKTYLEILGGCIAHLYGGGNNATVNKNTVIYINNDSPVLTETNVMPKLKDNPNEEDIAAYKAELAALAKKVGLSTFQSKLTSYAFNFARVFGGNKKAEMAIRPTWNLQKGVIRDLYSGGDQGAMTSPNGILLVLNSPDIEVENVYGGCRMADVNPAKNAISEEIIGGVRFPAGYSARVLVTAGDIDNVYGGNDITGNVYGGNAVGIHSSIKGDVYGGGNGSYAYTDNATLGQSEVFKDFYYDPGSSSVDALNAFRPNAQAVSIRVVGTDAAHPTIIGGAIYCGGNSATLRNDDQDATAELKIGSYVKADQVFLGNNGVYMVDENVLKYYAGNVDADGNVKTTGTDFSSLDLTASATFASYMDGCAMMLRPQVTFDDEEANNDPATYIPYTSYFGSFYCGGNVGSLKINGLVSVDFNHEVVIFDKLVGGCNNAYVEETSYNAAYAGGVIGAKDDDGNKLQLNLSGLKIEPMRWVDENDKSLGLEWNTTGTDDVSRRLIGGNVYGGCCESGVVDGNVIVNIDATIMERDKLFAEVAPIANDDEDIYFDHTYSIKEGGNRNSGVILAYQATDVLGSALNVFGGGKGAGTQIWGSTTLNLNRGYVFQVFGGSEEGIIGKPNANGELTYNPAYSCYVNLNGTDPGVSRKEAYNENMPECEFLYGGGFQGPVAGNTMVNLNNGRIFSSCSGSCDADILGHAETYIGRAGFPWIRYMAYGGNDLGGEIKGTAAFSTSDYLRPETEGKRHSAGVLTASSYVEYRQGRAEAIFGGHYGTYDYKNEYKINGDPRTIEKKPRMGHAFVNFRPTNTDDLKNKETNVVNIVYGGSQGFSGDFDSNKMQESSYVLIDIPQDMENFKNMQVFGAGAWGGMGMRSKVNNLSAQEIATLDETQKATYETSLDRVSAIIDLVRGQIGVAYGGSYQEGVTRRSVVNVPTGSTICIGSIFGGAYGTNTYLPCDVYEANVNFRSSNAKLIYDPGTSVNYRGAIYGGNNSERRTLYGRVNIFSEVNQDKVIQYKDEIKGWDKGKVFPTKGTVYGAGQGGNTWSEYTEVNLESGAEVYEVFGGGQKGKIYNTESVTNFMKPANKPTSWPKVNPDDENEVTKPFTDDDWAFSWELGHYNPATGKEYWEDSYTNLTNPLVRVAEMDDRDFTGLSAADKALVQNRYSANVIIKEGATVDNYAYGAGYGQEAVVSGTTYITLLGGEVVKDIYAAGTSGSVEDLHAAGVYNSTNRAGFVASANVYIKGGTVRNVYGGGWRGSVGHHGPLNQHTGEISLANDDDIDGEVHVVIGDVNGSSHINGIPSITRNVYGGGEGGAIFGDAYVKINNGYIGYRYNASGTDVVTTTDINEKYEPELDDVEENDNLLDRSGNVFGGGYVANSYVDRSHVIMQGGIVRGSLYGGGEIGPVGRGTVKEDIVNALADDSPIKINGAAIYKDGETHVELWDGHVMRDVFGGGRGYDNWGKDGWMTEEEEATMDRSSKGYVFGSTDVHIYGGEIGTEANVLKGYGNVFGGGNEGFVYSAIGKKVGSKQNSDQLTNGLPTDGGGFYYKGGTISNGLTLDCNVVVEPRCKVTDAGGIGGFTVVKDADNNVIAKSSYSEGEYVPVEAMNQMKSRSNTTDWGKLDTRGVVIHNAIFAGGNITEGSDKLFANTVTVYGNAAASLRDVYNFDLISLGTEDMGGLYGDGNLTLVDGFREVHIDNYGTDYYSLPETMELTDYNVLSDRQKAYYKLKYVAKVDHTYDYYESRYLHTYETTSYRKGQKIPRPSSTYDGFDNDERENWTPGTKSYKVGDQIEEGEHNLMDPEEQAKWDLWGVTSIYAGRPMNTIQRADMCGVFGSRLVLKGAVDRAPQVNGGVDYNNYTINRVDEVSLNKRTSQAGDATTSVDYEHGNYFGIYSSVKFLGNLTSDVLFDDIRKTNTDNNDIKDDGSTTYYQWKHANPQWKYRNNGISHNKVALASGVYLEIKREEGENTGTDDWGYITGVVELDLINVMPGMGGGYVYAKNEHGTKTRHSDWGKVTLLNENIPARTYRHFTYSSSTEPIETSGNFVHNTKQIVDDCYPNGGIYNDGYVQSPAHYWFIRGSIYVYDQYISAYTGAANATAEKQEIPLTITAASNGRMTLRDVKPNYYAYYNKYGAKLGESTNESDNVFIVNNVSYTLNQPISYWDYQLLSEGDQAKFVDETYVVIADCKIGDTEYKKGTVMLPNEYNPLKASNPPVTYIEDGVEKTGEFAYFFRSSNNLSHNTGYVLTYDVNNPMVWNNYYTKTAAPGQANALNTDQYNQKTGDNYTYDHSLYTEGPTYTLNGNSNGVFAQQDYIKGNIIYGSVVTNYKANIYDPDHSVNNLGSLSPTTQATVEKAYVVTKEHSVKDTNDEEIQHLNPGTPIYKSKYTDAQWSALTAAGAVEAAKVCTSLLEFSTTDYVWAGKVLSSEDIAELKTKVMEKNAGWTPEQATTYLNGYLDDAYYCTKEGKYGGVYFQAGRAYRAIDTWCSMPEEERANFTYNYDALDLLIDPTFGGEYGSKPQYDGSNAEKVYSSPQAIDYTAEYTGSDACQYDDENGNTVTYTSSSPWLTREQYEDIPNEKHNYSPITITKPGDYYMVHVAFMNGEVPYTVGQQIDADTYETLGAKKDNVDVFTFTSDHTNTPTLNENNEEVYAPKTYYYCRKAYTVNEKGEGADVTSVGGIGHKRGSSVNTTTTAQTYSTSNNVPQDIIIAAGTSSSDAGTYSSLCNFQSGFVIHGTSPTEVSTLYVSNESDIHDLSTEKIITVIYLYEYEESDETGLNVTPVSERHIVNIHINFKSGVPEIGDIAKPDIVLPGTTIGMNIPSVTQGAYRVTESGWEIFSNPDDAATHYNGVPFYNNETPLYWYQNNYWIAYYAQTSLGKTYSKSVPLSVANYHDLKKVMDDQDHHYYIDHRDVGYAPKIYINDYKTDDPATSQNGLDLLKNLIDLSYVVNNDADGNPQKISGGTLDGHMPMASRLRGGNNLEFFLRTNLDHTGTEWTPIANNTGECFSAMLHGDGHSISGLDHSLINHLCGHIYNLGVSGSFTSSGIAEEGDGYLENCWIKTTGTPASNTHPLFGTPTATSFSQVVNCYYQEDGETALYTPFTGDKNMAVKKPSSAFNNGEVAYNLNGFYLNKRYYEGKGTAEPATSAKPELTSGSSYVNGRYADGDFIYANGTIPSSPDERLITDTNGDPVLDTNGKQQYLPTWPDDYLFFGQTLNYGYVENVPYEIVPSAITATNRVYRAPAYFGNSTMRVAHFNPNAVFAKSMKDDETVVAYKGMTAIDFTGYNDVFNATNGEAKPYQQGLVSGQFYAPLLNDAGLTDFTNVDLTRNLLAYTGTSTAAATTTNDVIQSKLTDETYEDYVTDTYLTVEEAQDRKSPSVKGHWIQQSTESVSNYVATRDHFLVDKEVFNAPIAYTFDATSRMWYQRLPENYVGKKKEAGSGFIENGAGWEGISIPFKAEIVATDTKGEITHFYNEGDNWKGHEYWLREYKGQKDGTTVTADGIFTANFSKPEPSAADESEFDTKHYFNTFLWNYYYKNNDFDDKNSDKYPRTYYSESHDYVNYPRLASATPYIIGFPGERYYEFDLSGNFVPKTAKATTPAKLSAQVITFASAKKAKIGVSDTELEAGKESHDGYIFVPNYGNETLSSVAYILNTNDENVDKRGGSYDKVASDAVTVPFRPYFSKLASAREVTRSIIFSEDNSQLQVDDDREQIDEAYSLSIYAKRKKIVVESNLREITEVRIVNTAGITMATFTIEPGETVETRIINSGVYIVQTADARYTKKLAVK